MDTKLFFEKILIDNLAQIQSNSSESITDSKFSLLAEDLKDEIDLTSSAREQAMQLRLRNRQTLLVKKIEAALERLKAGTFGTCESCEEEIEIKRLMARPMTTYCRKCKEAREHLEQSHIDGRKHKSLGQGLRRIHILTA